MVHKDEPKAGFFKLQVILSLLMLMGGLCCKLIKPVYDKDLKGSRSQNSPLGHGQLNAHIINELNIEPVFYKAGSPSPPENVSLKTIIVPSNASDPETREGHAMMSRSDCYSCHGDFKTLAAPSYIDIAIKYRNDPGAVKRLATHIISGSKGIWEDREMKSHPELLREDAQKMVKYILSLSIKKSYQRE